jgi:Helix-turn-helix domain
MSQLKKLDAHFAAGGSLTPGEALMQFGIYALSQRCGELRRRGHPISWRWELQPSGARVKRYYREGAPCTG